MNIKQQAAVKVKTNTGAIGGRGKQRAKPAETPKKKK